MLSFVFLLVSSIAHGADGAPAPAAARPGAAAAPKPPPPTEVAELSDAFGRTTERTEFAGDVRLSQINTRYDARGRPIEVSTHAGGRVTVVTTAYLPGEGAKKVEEHTTVDGVETKAETWTYKGGLVQSDVVVESGRITRQELYTYNDEYDQLVQRVVKDGAGNVLLTTNLHPSPPVVPIQISVGGGFLFDSEVNKIGGSALFEVARKPRIERVGADPLEVRAAFSYAYQRSMDEVTTSELKSRFSIDLNQVRKATSVFGFVDFDRNAVSNLNADVSIAVPGVKLDLVPRDLFKLDLSLAPLMNFRSIFVEDPTAGDCPGVSGAGTACNDLRLRASTRLRVGWEKPDGLISVVDTLEYQPTLYRFQQVGSSGATQSVAFGMWDDAILRNTAALSVRLTDWLTLSDKLIWTRDPALALQATCDGSDPFSDDLCAGQTLRNEASVKMTWGVVPRKATRSAR